MSSPAPIPLTERVMQIVRASTTGLVREEVEEQLPDVDRLEVRAALKTLRGAHHLDAIAEDGTVLYRSPEHKPARQEGSSLVRPPRARPVLNLVKTPAAAPAPAASRVVRLLGEEEAEPTTEDEMPKKKVQGELDPIAIVNWIEAQGRWLRRGEIEKGTKTSGSALKRLLEDLVKGKTIQARGERAGCRYAGEKFTEEVKPAKPAANAPAASRPSKAKSTAAIPAATLSGFALTLHVNLPDCKGTMTLDQAREFAAFVGTITGGAG